MMSFGAYPANARVWIFPLAQQLAPDSEHKLQDRLAEFLEGWKAHGDPLTASVRIEHGRFVVVVADQEKASASGCSIDALFRAVRATVSELGFKLLDNSKVFFLDGDRVLDVSREEFEIMCKSKLVTPRTMVFDNTITSLAEFRSNKWLLPLQDSWHGKVFPISD